MKTVSWSERYFSLTVYVSAIHGVSFFETMLCSILRNEKLDAGYIRCSRELQVPKP